MFIILVAIISLIIGLIRGGSIKNLFNGGIKCWWLFLVPILLFLALQAGQLLQISLITNNAFLIMVIAYILLFVCIFFNLDNIWMYLLLAGGLLNFVVIFINQAKMPLNPSALSIAHLGEGYLTRFAATVVAASSSTKLAFLGGIIPIPLVSIFRQVISPGTLVMAISTFAILQNALIYTYIDEAQYEKYLSEENADSSSEDPVPTMPILEGIQQARQTNSLEDIREQLGEFGYGPVEEDEVKPIDENIEEEDIPIDVFDEEDEAEEIIPVEDEAEFEQEAENISDTDDDFIANFEDDVDGEILDAFVEGDIEKIDQELSDLGINQDDEQSLPYEDEEEFSFEEDLEEQESDDEQVEEEEDNTQEESIFEDSDAILQEEMDNIEDTLNTIEDEFDDIEQPQADEIDAQDENEDITDEEVAIEEPDVIDEDEQDIEMEIEDEVDDLYNSVFDDNMNDIEDDESIDQDLNSSDDIFEMPDISALNMINDTPSPSVNESINAVPVGVAVPGVTKAEQAQNEEQIEEELDKQMTRTFTPIRERNQSFEDVLGDDEPIEPVETTPTEVLEQMEDEGAKDSESIEFIEYQEEPLTEDLDEIVRKVQQEEVASEAKTIIRREDIINDSPEKITVERPKVKDINQNELKEEDINDEADKAFNSHIKHQEEMNNKVNVDSPFMIIDGNIVENPNYKFRKGPKEEEKSKEDLQDSSVYVMNSGSLSELDKDNTLTGAAEPVFEVTPKEEKIIEEITREVKEEIKNTSSLPTSDELEEIMDSDTSSDVDVSAVSEVMGDNEDDIIIDKGKYNTANINELRELAKDYDPSISAVSEIETEDTEQVSVIEPEPIEEENPYEKVEMKIGDVEIKFWKKDNDKQKG